MRGSFVNKTQVGRNVEFDTVGATAQEQGHSSFPYDLLRGKLTYNKKALDFQGLLLSGGSGDCLL